jgi:sialic acid synthase
VNRPLVVAEIGCNHRGEASTAQEMIRVAASICGVDVVKFQKRNPRESLTAAQYMAPHPQPANSYGATYGEHREALELDINTHRRLKELCDEWNVIYSSSVWDLTSAREIVSLEPALIKVPSACNTHYAMLEYLCGEFAGELHISLGMTTRKEEGMLIEFLQRRQRLSDTVLYACVSGYPVCFADLSLLEIQRLRQAYAPIVKGIGFSGHHLGIAADIAAMTLGAQYIERHFTLDRTWKGTDHAASLEPDGLRRLVRDIHHVSLALRKKAMDLLPVELPQRAKLKQLPVP